MVNSVTENKINHMECVGTAEEIICPTCHNRISEITSLRCPRCFSPLVKGGCSGNCKRCCHQK